MKILISLTLFLPLLAVTQAHAFRCQNGNLVLEGDTTLEVVARCGQPAIKEFVGTIKIDGRYVSVDRYLYVPNSGYFLRIVEFYGGVVVRIIRGRRVE